MSGSLWPPELQHARLPCTSLSPGVCSNSCPLSQRCYLTVSSSVTHFSSCPQSFQASGSFPMSQLFTSGYIWVNEWIKLQKEVWFPNAFQIFITCYFGCFFNRKRLHWGSLYWIICVDHNKLWKILKEMEIQDHTTCLLRNLYSDEEATFKTGHGTTDWFQVGKGVRQV